MPLQPSRRIKLLWLILGLTIASALVSLGITLVSSYHVQRQHLIDTTLDHHQAYATKVAASIDDFTLALQQQLAYSAQQVAPHMGNNALLEQEVRRLQHQTNSFNSVALIDADSKLRAYSLPTYALRGTLINTYGVQEALQARRPLISAPYVSLSGTFVVFVSHPIYDAQQRYLGLVGGTIYLRQDSILKHLLGAHFYKDDSYVFIVDSQHRIIEHPDHGRIGDRVQHNPVVDAIAQGRSGQQRIVNSRGVDMLAGYAIVPRTGWGVVSQRPTASALALVDQLMASVVLRSAPLALVCMVLIVWCARRISRPLQQLAKGAHDMDQPGTPQALHQVQSWYFEAAELKRALLLGIGLIQRNMSRLRKDAQTDALTGLANRRGLDSLLALWSAEQQGFAAIAVDVDHFKRINDRFGHAAGDAVLQALAQQLQGASRSGDIACRVGGEEFLLLLPGAPLAVALDVAERLRARIAAHNFPNVGAVSISAGVAHCPADAADAAAVLQLADERLYQAKQAGRNTVVGAATAP